ncbi:lipopolysaccharide heptosyltransferase 1, partial [Salmonella enterica]|nr:lipopolysaccharide heptosyltransferase 1 [Salmonella enterica]
LIGGYGKNQMACCSPEKNLANLDATSVFGKIH